MTPRCLPHHWHVTPVEDGVVLSLVGASARVWHEEEVVLFDCQDILQNGRPERVYLDLASMDWVRDSILSQLVQLYGLARKWNGKSVLCNLYPEGIVVFEVMRLTKVFEIRREPFPSVTWPVPDPSWLAWNDGAVVLVQPDLEESLPRVSE